jgi:protein-disulfide isomerase
MAETTAEGESMRVAGWTSLPIALALGLLAGSAPALTAAQESSPTACGSDTTQCHRGAESDADATSDQAGMTPSTELRIDEPFGHAWLGAADADVTLVVFADYACPACREAQPVIDQLLAQDSKLKVVYRFLDNEQGGRTAALTSLAVAKQSADWAKFHRALDASGDPSSETVAKALAASGVEQANLPDFENEDDPDTVTLADELSRNDKLINQRNGSAIPSWVIGDGPAQKGFDLARLQAAIAKARAAKGR